jgi:DNA-binding transcriptional MerR regulator
MRNIAKSQRGLDAKSALETAPQKLYYKIGEVCAITKIPSHVLRFWEKQFPQLSPNKTPSGHRLYKRRDIQVILQIKELLYERRFTIQGAREYLASSRRGPGEPPAPPPPAGESLGRIKEALLRIKRLLDRPGPFDS